MNIFSEDAFLDALGQIYFPDQSLSIGVFELDGELWRLPVLNGKPLAGATLIDFFEPLDEADDKAKTLQSLSRPVRYLSQASHTLVSCSQWIEQGLEQECQPSPTVLWHQFDSWEAFIQHARQKESRLFSDARRRQRKLEKELGSIQVILNDQRPEVLETCLQWKSAQLRRNNLSDPFSNPTHLKFLRELATRQLLIVSSLTAGETLLAVHVGMQYRERFSSWITTYDASFSQYAPGRLLLHTLLEESFNQQHKEFDFLVGGEDYKWNYATHVRLVAEIGVPPFPKKVKRFVIRLLITALRPFPDAKRALKTLGNRFFSAS